MIKNYITKIKFNNDKKHFFKITFNNNDKIKANCKLTPRNLTLT